MVYNDSAFVIYKNLNDLDKTNLEYQFGLALANNNIGDIYYNQKSISESKNFFTKSHFLILEVLKKDSNNFKFKFHLALILEKLGDIATYENNNLLALNYFNSAVSICNELYNDRKSNIDCIYGLAISSFKLAIIYFKLDKKTKAKEHLKTSEFLLNKLVSIAPGNTNYTKYLNLVMEKTQQF